MAGGGCSGTASSQLSSGPPHATEWNTDSGNVTDPTGVSHGVSHADRSGQSLVGTLS